MARVRNRRIFWELPPAATHGNVYAGAAGDAGFLAAINSGAVTPNKRIPAASPQEWVFGVGELPDGNYQFGVVAESETSGKFADPYQHPAWANVPLDLSPLPPAFGGGFELL